MVPSLRTSYVPLQGLVFGDKSKLVTKEVSVDEESQRINLTFDDSVNSKLSVIFCLVPAAYKIVYVSNVFGLDPVDII